MSTASPTRNAQAFLSSEDINKLLCSIEEVVIILTSQGEIKQCNQACESIGGYATSELVGRNIVGVFALIHEVDLFQQLLSDIAAGLPVDKFEAHLFSKAGVMKQIRWSGCQLADDHAGGCTILLTGIDISAEREAQAELSTLEQSASTPETNRAPLIPGPKLSGEDSDAERRTECRPDFPQKQRVAIIENGVLPKSEEYQYVEFLNISSHGCAFYLDKLPNSPECIVELGTGSDQIYLTAMVVYAKYTPDTDRSRYLVGCRYTQRVTE